MNHLDVAFIVDDDPIHQFGMKVLLRKLKLFKEIQVYQNGQEALNALTTLLGEGKQLPSIIFLDLNMPVMDGWDFLEDFIKIPHANREKITIYVISSSINPSDLEKARQFEVVSNYLVKPIDETELVKVLEKLGYLSD